MTQESIASWRIETLQFYQQVHLFQSEGAEKSTKNYWDLL